MKPARGVVLVKPIETAESFAGSKILLVDATRERIASGQYEVVSVGAPAICKDEDCTRFHRPHTSDLPFQPREHPIDSRLTAGAWVVVQPRALVDAGREEKSYFVRADDILGVFCGES